MPFQVVTRTRLERVGSMSAKEPFTVTLEDGTVIHGMATWPHYPSYKFAVDPEHYPDEVSAAIDEAYEELIQRTIENHNRELAKDPAYFNEQFLSLTPRQRAEATVSKPHIEAIITSDLEIGHPELLVKIGNPYTGEYQREVHYRSPITALSVE